jgi:3-methylcrotonyl-CoA carboxylase alpha subunit
VLFLDGEAWPFAAPVADRAGGGAVSDGVILSPMPGRIIAVEIGEGEPVVRGQKLIVLEAMKMEHALIAPFDGVVQALNASVGDHVAEGTRLTVIAPAP